MHATPDSSRDIHILELIIARLTATAIAVVAFVFVVVVVAAVPFVVVVVVVVVVVFVVVVVGGGASSVASCGRWRPARPQAPAGGTTLNSCSSGSPNGAPGAAAGLPSELTGSHWPLFHLRWRFQFRSTRS